MIKKILISIGVLFSFFFMFLFGLDKINVLAYSDIGNALGSYPVKLDIDNYNRYNLVDFSNYRHNIGEFNSNVTQYNDPSSQTLTISTTTNNSNNSYGFIIYNLFDTISLNNDNYYTFSFYISTPLSNNYYTIGFEHYDGNNLCPGLIENVESGVFYYTFKGYCINNYNYPFIVYYRTIDFSDNRSTFYVFDQILYEGQDIKQYAPYFKFGYNVNYFLAVNNLTSNQINAGIAITDANGNYLKTGSCVIPAGSSTICNNLNDPLYLPFSIDNNGYISFNYSLGLFLGPVGNLSVTPNDSGFNFVPVFNAYYNGSSTNNLYFKDRYTFNNLFLSGFNVSVNSSTLSKVSFPRTQIDSEYSMNSNKIVNFATDKKIETGIYNYINFVDFINSNPSDIYSFVITTGVSRPDLFDNRIYTISFSNLSLKVNGDSSNSSPLPNNPSTINKYNECSAWYDIPCQFGNGLTYVIYEAPIISPVLTFIVSFITMFSSLVSFVDLFRSFGIVFGCFIIYMFINLLHKYSK